MIKTNNKNNRQLELLKKHYDIDEINKLVSVTFRYDKATDVLVEDLGKNSNPQFEWDVLTRVNKVIDSLPLGYKVNIEFSIDDYQEYSPDTIIESFNEELELNSFGVRKSRNKTWLIASILVIVGVALLIFMSLGALHGWFGIGTQSDIIVEIIDIAACVFVWEAVSMVFLEHSEETGLALTLKKRIASVKLIDSKTQEVVKEEGASEIFKNWKEEKPIFKVGKSALLFASSAFICMAFFGLYNVFEYCLVGDHEILDITWMIVFGSVAFLFHTLAGVAGMFKYIGSENKITKIVPIGAIILFVFLLTSIIVNAINGSTSSLVVSASSFIFNLFYIFGFLATKNDNN